MAKIIIYCKVSCSYCVRAKQLLDQKHVTYEEILVDENLELFEEMVKKSGRRTVPQIFIDDRHIGGFDDLYALNVAGQLDPLLK